MPGQEEADRQVWNMFERYMALEREIARQASRFRQLAEVLEHPLDHRLQSAAPVGYGASYCEPMPPLPEAISLAAKLHELQTLHSEIILLVDAIKDPVIRDVVGRKFVRRRRARPDDAERRG